MRFSVVLLIVSTTSIAGGESILGSLVKLMLSPRVPDLIRVRRIEEAKGDPYAVLDTAGLVEQYGYPAKEHKVTTKDGYNIVFFEIAGSPKSPPAKGKPIVFLQHGMLLSSDMWVHIGPHHDIGFLLADAGYDVWLGNIRGNTYCRSHTNLSTTSKEFWDFSWHEGATLDLPSMIDYALEYTGEKSLFYIGYSMGTTMSHILLSEKPEYNEKMRLVINLTPAGSFEKKPTDFLEFILSLAPSFMDLFNSMDIHDLAPQMKLYAELVEPICSNSSTMQYLCIAAYQTSMPLLLGEPAKGFDTRTIPRLVSYFPAGVSIRTALHYQQCWTSGVFKQYDYGPTKNSKIYGTKEPPQYNLSKISAPYVLIYGNTDDLTPKENAIYLGKKLPNLVSCEPAKAPIFNHIDFFISPLARNAVYNRIIELLSKY